MSAIWGAIQLGQNRNRTIGALMGQSFAKCILDRVEERQTEDVFMGCGIQYFTPEASLEVLPIFDEEQQRYFDADVVLDNREELFQKLEIPIKEQAGIPDGTLLFKMLQRYGDSCLNELLGAYTFVYYDREKKTVMAAIDATGDRCLYYRIVGNVFYYSTLIEPLAAIEPACGKNERWMADFVGMDHLFMINELEETPVRDVYRIAPAQKITIRLTPEGTTELTKMRYWNFFEDFKEKKVRSDRECQIQFCELWTKAVQSVMRSRDEISILLSGGMDSTAVTSVAAPYLKNQGRTLHSYTSVPLHDYTFEDNGYDVPDERQDVLKTAEYYGNIDCHFLDLAGVNPWDARKEEVRAVEMPYKSVENFLWIAASMRQAYQNKSRIMLGGSYGNSSISYTDFEVYMNTLCHRGRWMRLYHELTTFQKRYGYSRKYALKQILKTNFGPKTEQEYGNICGRAYIRQDARMRLGVDERLKKMRREMAKSAGSFAAYRENMINWKAFRQIGEVATKHSLYTGVLMRDPTKDKRIIEFCASLPVEQFTKNGEDRRLVRIYLAGQMPEHIMTYNRKGKQSADVRERLALDWERIRQEWIHTYQKHQGDSIVDCNRAIEELQTTEEIQQLSVFDLTRHIYTLMVLEYEI